MTTPASEPSDSRPSGYVLDTEDINEPTIRPRRGEANWLTFPTFARAQVAMLECLDDRISDLQRKRAEIAALTEAQVLQREHDDGRLPDDE
jgi:hypothetical protein